MLLHAFGLPVEKLGSQSQQRAITSEFRTGTIRPTLLVTPRRAQVIAAKILCALLVGAVTGVLAAGTAAGAGSIGLAIRGVTVCPVVLKCRRFPPIWSVLARSRRPGG